ncbi:MAG: glycosyltransferase [Nitrosopumilaceae archaeon]
MEILHAGNMANLGYIISKNLRKEGISADLLMEKQPNEMSDPINIDSSLNRKYPDWIKFFDKNKSTWKLDILKIMRNKKYDLIHSYVEFPIFSYISQKPFLAYAQGSDLRELAFSKSLRGNLLRRAYKKAKLVITAQPDHVPLISKLKIIKWIFLPIPWEITSFPEPSLERKNSEILTIFHPSNLNWRLKGNDTLIRGFSKFVQNNSNSKLIIVDRGIDSSKTHDLVNSLGIGNKVEFILGPLTHSQLLKMYVESDLIADQFVIGSMGSIALEAMLCEKPILTFLHKELHYQLYSEIPPAVIASNQQEINEKLELLNDKKTRIDLGKKGKNWVSLFHSPKKISQKLKIIYEGIHNNYSLDEIKFKINKE